MPYAKIKLNGLINVNAHQILPCLCHQKQAKTSLPYIRKSSKYHQKRTGEKP
ncbi:hypothetical protein HMPREF1991_01720 [Hoylesella loescheii DSM 19665 = JCM 12249 = ATCC 15930]|uniref:Uncharacterized protein n=1 Tax=Hoylesella loescheii DSM 19665 = JCM 12249 = ATCC 15930 TaxID=1122985 RepID=A0A069QQU3_HOYLO|nr:hypothetical protein HMPREF1991_01720 [Hoylesella loescheii DSM 19665 = JCM 12249 = ATCC 15930]